MRLPFALVTALAAVSLASCGGGEETVASDDSEPTSQETTTTPAEPTDIVKAGAKAIEAPGEADWLADGAGSIWVNFALSVRRVDPETGEFSKPIDVPQHPCQGTVFAYGSFWASTCEDEGLIRIDPSDDKVSDFVPLEVPDVYSEDGTIDAGEGAIWLVLDAKDCEACVLAGVDPKTLELTHEIVIPRESASVDLGGGYVWVTNPRDSTVLQIDPNTDGIQNTVDVSDVPQFVAADETGVWVFSQLDGIVTRLDPETAEVVTTISADPGGGGAIVTGGGSVWLRGPLTLLTEIDPETNTIANRYGPASGTGDALVADDSVWISDFEERMLWELPLAE